MVSSVHWSKSLAHLLFSLTLFKLRWGTWPKIGSEVPGETRGWGASIRKRDEGREKGMRKKRRIKREEDRDGESEPAYRRHVCLH